MKSMALLGAVVGAMLSTSAVQAQNLLQNSSFEVAGGAVDGWTTFGNVFRETIAPITGSFGMKMFGNFTAGQVNYSGMFQDLPASAGQEWTVGVTGFNASFDAMQSANRAIVKIEFYDLMGNVLAFGESDVLVAGSPTGTPIPASVTSAAPAGTTRVRLNLLFEQGADGAAGAAFFDDVTASVLGGGDVAVTNPSFETAGPGGGPIANWSNFNNAFRTTNGPRTGDHNLTLATGTTSGVFQDFAALPGSVWEASVWGLKSTSSDPLTLPDFTVLNIEWRDEVNQLISNESVLVADGFTPADAYSQVTVSGTAPAGTSSARYVLLYFSAGGTGTIQMDDASFVRISTPPPPPPRVNMLNNAGFELALGFDFANQSNWNGFFGGPAGTFLEAFNNTGAIPFEGNQALVTTIRGSASTSGFNAFTGHVQVVPGVIQGTVYNFSVQARTNPTLNNGAEFRIEWRNAANAEVGRFNMPIESMLTGEYQQFIITDTAPESATKAAVVMAVQSFLNNGATADTSVAWDDARFGPAVITPSCPPDFNGDGTLDPDDLADYISAFFSQPAPISADYNGDGLVDPDDLADYISGYFAGC